MRATPAGSVRLGTTMVAWLSGGRVKRRRLPAWLLTIPIFAVIALLGKAQTTERRPDAVAPVPRGLSDKPVALVIEDGDFLGVALLVPKANLEGMR